MIKRDTVGEGKEGYLLSLSLASRQRTAVTPLSTRSLICQGMLLYFDKNGSVPANPVEFPCILPSV
jgi:hypothetical protein